MSNASHEHPPTAAEQIAQIVDKLKQIRGIVEGSKWSQELYTKVDDLTTEIRETIVAIFSNPTATAKQRQQAKGELLKESDRLFAAATKRHKQFFQKQQRAHEKQQ